MSVRYLSLIFLLCSSLLFGDKTIGVAAIFRNESRFLKEWIEYYRTIGVSRFYLTDNLSEDDPLTVLLPYMKDRIVDLDTSDRIGENLGDWSSIQMAAYNKAIKKAQSDGIDWLIVVDLDEFLVPKEKPLIEILKNYERYGGVGVNWQLFGTSSVKRIPDHLLLIETLLRKGPEDLFNNRWVKLIVQPSKVSSFKNPHGCAYKGRYYTVDTQKRKIKGKQSSQVHTDVMQINHYWTRDEDFFNQEKKNRKTQMGSWHDQMMQIVDQLDETIDDSILPFVLELRKRVGLDPSLFER